MKIINDNQIEMMQNMTGTITDYIKNIFINDEYGFEIYIVMKSEPFLKYFNLSEGRIENRLDPETNFKRKVQLSIEETIKEKFLDAEKEYDLVENIADNQNKFYVIPQNEDYKPFEIIKASLDDLKGYRANERENAKGVLFRFERSGNIMWAYQLLYSNAIPNRKGMGFHIVPSEGDTFEELKKPILLLSRRVDLLVIGDEIICDKIEFMQRNFGFKEYIHSTALKVVSNIQGLELVSNMDKVFAYVSRSRLLYAKKMMRIKNSRVLKKTPSEIFKSVTTLARWKGKFDVDRENRKIILNTYQQVENLIDLLDERYTRSDVTGEEYDTGTKKWIEPIEE